jgi:hypothetical protein
MTKLSSKSKAHSKLPYSLTHLKHKMAISSLQTHQPAPVFCSTNLKLTRSPLENENNAPSPSKATLGSFVEEAKVQCSFKSAGKNNDDEDSLPHAKGSKLCGQAFRVADKQETCELLSQNDFIICVATSYPTSPSTGTTNAISPNTIAFETAREERRYFTSSTPIFGSKTTDREWVELDMELYDLVNRFESVEGEKMGFVCDGEGCEKESKSENEKELMDFVCVDMDVDKGCGCEIEVAV